MYLAIDLGGTKTLLAVFDRQGKLIDEYKFPTHKNFATFIKDLSAAIANLGHHRFSACCCAVPGQLDRKKGIALHFGNLPWHDVNIKKELEKILGYIPIYMENDAKLAGLSEALAHQKYNRVLYLTISTGIGDGIIIDGKIDPNFVDSEPGQMMIEHDGRIQKWEDISSGRALVTRYGKRASEIEDTVIWREYSKALALGINELIAVLQPEVIIIGGGVGAHFEKFGDFLKENLQKLANAMVATPPIIKASRPEEAVIYGCYDFIKQNI